MDFEAPLLLTSWNRREQEACEAWVARGLGPHRTGICRPHRSMGSVLPHAAENLSLVLGPLGPL